MGQDGARNRDQPLGAIRLYGSRCYQGSDPTGDRVATIVDRTEIDLSVATNVCIIRTGIVEIARILFSVFFMETSGT